LKLFRDIDKLTGNDLWHYKGEGWGEYDETRKPDIDLHDKK